MKPGRRPRLVDEVRQDWKVSIRRACSCLRTDTSLYHYKAQRGDAGALWLPESPCAAAPGGMPVNAKRTYRLYKELGLQIRNKTQKRRVKAMHST